MARKLDPWPAISDLFSGLLVVCFVALIIFTMLASREEKVRKRADHIRNEIKLKLEKTLVRSKTRKCGAEDVCLDIDVRFETDKDEVPLEFGQSLVGACAALRETFEAMLEEDRRAVIIQVEGHTDQDQPEHTLDLRQRYKYNWDLSSKRASSVLFELDQCGLSALQVEMRAIGANREVG